MFLLFIFTGVETLEFEGPPAKKIRDLESHDKGAKRKEVVGGTPAT